MKKLLIGIVVDFNYLPTVEQSILLIKSIRLYENINFDIMVCYIGNMTDDYIEKLSAYNNIIFKQVSIFCEKNKVGNKLRFYEQAELKNYEYFGVLDCDTLVLNSFSNILNGEYLYAKIVDAKTLPYNIFKDIFKYYNINIPDENYISTDGNKTILYCNTGVVFFNKKYLENGFISHWLNTAKSLCENIFLYKNYHYFCEQSSLSIAYYSFKDIQYSQLPVEYNYPSHKLKSSKNSIYIIHYHDQIKDNISSIPYINDEFEYKLNKILN